MATFRIETELEDDGRWIAENVDVPGIMCYGTTREEAIRNVLELSRQVLADRQNSDIGPS